MTVPGGKRGRNGQDQRIRMHSPYLDQLLVPLAVALPRMLAKIEAKIPKSAPAEKLRLQNQAAVFREWLSADTSGRAPTPN